jgi:hypothetical protein
VPVFRADGEDRFHARAGGSTGIERIHKKMGEIDTGPGEAQGT